MVPDGCRNVAIRCLHVCDEVRRKIFDRAIFKCARIHDVRPVHRPKLIDQVNRRFPVFVGHSHPRVGFDKRLVCTNTKNIPIKTKQFDRVFEVRTKFAVALKHKRSLWMKVEFRGVRRQVVRRLRHEIGARDDGLPR